MNLDCKQSVSRNIWTLIFPFMVWGRKLTPETLRFDFFAGLTNAVVVLPQGVAYAMIAGLPPEYGLYAAIIPAIIAALFGSSWHLISGPTAPISIVVFTTLSPIAEPGTPEYIGLALTLTLMAGLFQLVLALARFGALVNFVSHSVVVGFTAGAAVVIASSQMKNLLGLQVSSDGTFISTWGAVLEQLGNSNLYSLGVASITLVSAILIKRFLPRWPNMLLAMIVGSFAAALLGAAEHGVALVGSIPSQLPPFGIPALDANSFQVLGSGALAIALLGLVEAVSIARSVATRSRQNINGNQEFMGQALANITGSFFSCYASSGSFTRTGVNYSAGAKTPLAAIIAALSLLAIVLLFSELTAYVPIPSMAAILLVVAYNLIDFHQIRHILGFEKSESAVLIVTFLATLMMAMEFSIYIGVILSLVFYLQRTSRPKVVEVLPDPEAEKPVFISTEGRDLPPCPQLRVIRIEGSLFFGAVSYIQDYLQSIDEPKVLIVGNGINFIDIAGAEMLIHEAQRRRDAGGALYFSNLKSRVYNLLLPYVEQGSLGENSIFPNKGVAINRIYSEMDSARCETCAARIFQECRSTDTAG